MSRIRVTVRFTYTSEGGLLPDWRDRTDQQAADFARESGSDLAEILAVEENGVLMLDRRDEP